MPAPITTESKTADIEKIVNGEAASFAATAAQDGDQKDVDISPETPRRRFNLIGRKSSTDESKAGLEGSTSIQDGERGKGKPKQPLQSREESFVHVNGDSSPTETEQSVPETHGGKIQTETHDSYATAVKEGETHSKVVGNNMSNGENVAKMEDEDKASSLKTTESRANKPKKRVSYADVAKKDSAEINDHDSEESYPPLDDQNNESIHEHEHIPPGPGGIRWAPLKVPANRRLQTLMVLCHCLCILGLVSLFFLCCANPFLWPLLIPYLLHVLISKAGTDGSLAYRSEWFRNLFIWKWFCGYFPAQLHKTADLPQTRKYIFGYHPHGIISHGAWAAFATNALGFSEKFPGITNSLLTLDSNFRLPFYRDYVLAMGVRSVSKESITNILTRGGHNGEGMGRAVTIVIGGARESLEAQPGRMRLILKERKGFIKLAIRTGADLVPVLCFGENEIYDQVTPKTHPTLHKIQMFILKVWKFTLPFMHGRGIFNYDVGLMPYRHPLNVVVGAPIKVVQSSSVDTAEVNRLHDEYVAELESLWNRYKDEFLENRKEEMQILA